MPMVNGSPGSSASGVGTAATDVLAAVVAVVPDASVVDVDAAVVSRASVVAVLDSPSSLLSEQPTTIVVAPMRKALRLMKLTEAL
jgi:hypothetical protein